MVNRVNTEPGKHQHDDVGIIIVYRYITIKPHFVPESPYAVFGGIIHGFSLSHAPLSEEPFVLLSITRSAKALNLKL